jgi:hypothetical protein
MKLILLAAAMLASCATTDHSCTFGGATPADDDRCAVQNFGVEGAAYLRERLASCPRCGIAGPDMQYCALNCFGDERAENP